MRYTMNFGALRTPSAAARPAGRNFHIAVLGDFSGRANAGTIDAGAKLANRMPYFIDVDNYESVLAKIAPRLRLPLADEGSADVAVGALDDFHPDQLYANIDIFNKLAGLRKRLQNTSTFVAAANELQSWSNLASHAKVTRAPPKAGGGAAVPRGKLDDFARLIGRTTSAARTTSIDELLKRIVAPHVVPAPQAGRQMLLDAVDDALSSSMRRILHHPDFQSLEAAWRSIELLVRNLECDSTLKIQLFDISAEELAADLSSSDALEETGLYELLVAKPAVDGLEPPAVLLGNYVFELIPPHAELLGRIAKIAAAAQAPFIAGISADSLRRPNDGEVHPLVEESWTTLRSMPHAQYLGLTSPRFMLRWPYGPKSDPILSFAFDEFTPQEGLKGMLWANGSILAGLLLGQTFQEQGLPGMELGSHMVLGDVPFHYYTDEHGDQVALPCTERWITEPLAMYAKSLHLMPVLSIRGRPEIRLGGFGSLHGPDLAGPWAPVAVPPDEARTVAMDRASSVATGEAKSGADELSALLDSLAANEAEPTSGDSDIDPELAELLKDL
jgi:hypothetical protein